MSEDLSALSDEELKARLDAIGQIKVGDVVRLKSGGPDLTIEALNGEGAYVMWFMGASLQRAEFKLIFLQRDLTDKERGEAFDIEREMVRRLVAWAEETGLSPKQVLIESAFFRPEAA